MEVCKKNPGFVFDWKSSYLQFSNLIISLLEFNLSEVSVQPVHLFRVRHWMDSQSFLELFTLLFAGIRVFSQLIMVVLKALRRNREVFS